MEQKQNSKNYKDTLNLPKTSFAMKANLAQREPEMLKLWENEGLYASIRKKSAGKTQYILHDGPPYANGKIHIGHALNKILKDIIVKYKTMSGYDALYVPGWDCHGLPIEHQCLKDMGKRKDEVERVAFRKQARQYAEKFIATQREDFKRLGIMGQWQEPYLTMNYGYQAAIAESFLSLYEKGFIYQDLKPVPWCFDCETALADAELEYADKTSTAVYVKFPVDPESFNLKFKYQPAKPLSFLAWTTTPWTLPANVGLAVNPKLSYIVMESADEMIIVAEALSLTIKNLSEHFKAERNIPGEDLSGLFYHHPFIDRKGEVIAADYVSAEDGTGIVHIAPGHGEDDYFYGHVKNKLPILSPVDHKGRFSDEFPPAAGIHVFKANDMIIEILSGKGALLHSDAHAHSYPHCWRCKKPILFRATEQWFMKIDHRDLRQRMLKAIEKEICFTPDWGKRRIGSMVETRPEWCLSRQRYWGVPIPMIGCKNCTGQFFVTESKAIIADLFEKEGADCWFSRPVSDFLPEGFSCPSCGKQDFYREEDIVDVWFDSGVSHQAVLRKTTGLNFPADLYLEGSDQHRGWFQSSLTTSMALEETPPFKGVLTHGFVMDGEGKKMSKSAGNVVAPQDVMKEFGADILRLWVSSCAYEYDVRLSKDILKQLADAYRKIRNTFRYMLSNLFDYDPAVNKVPFEQLHPLDQWAVAHTDQMIDQVETKYQAFEFHQIYQLVHHFCVIHLSGYYFDILKDILYTSGADSARRRSAQTALFYILTRLTKVLTPILPFTMDEVWRAFELERGIPSVHLSEMAFGKAEWNKDLYQTWQDIRNIRNAVTLCLEKKREEKIIGANLDAKVILSSEDPAVEELLKANLNHLPAVFVVSQVEYDVQTGQEVQTVQYESLTLQKTAVFKVSVQKADGHKCVRCWNYSSGVGQDAQDPELCEKCLKAVRQLTP